MLCVGVESSLDLALDVDVTTKAMNGRDDADEEVEADAVAGLKAGADRLAADARDAHLAVGLVGERVVHVVRQLAVDADRLHAVQHGVAGSFEHGLSALGSELGLTGYQLPATSYRLATVRD